MKSKLLGNATKTAIGLAFGLLYLLLILQQYGMVGSEWQWTKFVLMIGFFLDVIATFAVWVHWLVRGVALNIRRVGVLTIILASIILVLVVVGAISASAFVWQCGFQNSDSCNF